MLKEKKIIYMAPGPTGDFDNDGRLDLFLPNWWPESRSLLLRNETPGGNWLDVAGGGRGGRQPHGHRRAREHLPGGQARRTAALLGCREIAPASATPRASRPSRTSAWARKRWSMSK